MKEAKETVTQAPPPVVENRKISARLKTLKRDQGKLEARLSKPLPTQEIGDLGLELKAVDEELASHEEKWLAISE